ncbi:hypothetical protein ABZ470_21455 [Streptosporangium sp. NPDC020072]|uniref:hypothetical protein n=1 Tax=Streptosporangium sp. NPDC020072 TaxID=3154788 RepID=UPI00344ABBE9
MANRLARTAATPVTRQEVRPPAEDGSEIGPVSARRAGLAPTVSPGASLSSRFGYSSTIAEAVAVTDRALRRWR